MEKLPKNIPLFPLPGALLLPNSRLPLNIFEPRYIRMVEDTLATKHRLIGMIQPIKLDKRNKLAGTNKFQKVGCAGRIVSFTETEDGRYLIVLNGVAAFVPFVGTSSPVVLTYQTLLISFKFSLSN